MTSRSESFSSRLFSNASEALQKHCSRSKSPYIAGVSGGVDSMVMLHWLAMNEKYDLIVAHINYGKRGEESDSDETLVRTFCSEHHIPIRVFDIRKDALESTGKHSALSNYKVEAVTGNFQEHARTIRFRFFHLLMEEIDAHAVFLAHHHDDQIETIFQKIMRGAAVERWQGMKSFDYPWIRPLLLLSKKDLLEYAVKHKVPFRTDSSNLKSIYARNLIRNRVFPQFDSYYPGWKKNLMRMAGFGAIHQDLLDYTTDQVTEVRNRGGTAVTPRDFTKLKRSRWLELPSSLKLPVARNWIYRQTGFIGWSRGNVGRLADLEHVQTGASVSISDHYYIMRDRDYFVICLRATENKSINDQTSARFRESAVQGKAITADTTQHQIQLDKIIDIPYKIWGCEFSESIYLPERVNGILQLGRESLPGTLIIRRWKKGDRFQPFGMTGSQSVADHLANRKISADQKKEALVLVSFDEKIHAVIFPYTVENGMIGTIAEHTRCHSPGQRILLIKKSDYDK